MVPVAELRPAVEAVLMVADEPLDEMALATVLGYPADEVVGALRGLAAEYDEQRRGFELRNVAGGWRFYTREAYANGNAYLAPTAEGRRLWDQSWGDVRNG